jgi:hypothetical protein
MAVKPPKGVELITLPITGGAGVGESSLILFEASAT